MAPKQKRGGRGGGGEDSAKKQKYALALRDPLRRVWIYILIDRRTSKVVYVGQSVDYGRRWQQHEAKSDSGIKAYLEREGTTFGMLKLKIVDELPNGCALRDADKFEAYFISHFRTVYDMNHNKHVANDTNGNYARKVDPVAVAAELEAGYVWPTECAAAAKRFTEAPKELEEARANVEILETILIENPDVEGVEAALSTALTVRAKLETGPYEYALKAFETYEAMPTYEPINRDALVAQLNTIKDMSPSDTKLQEEHRRVWMRVTHSDQHRSSDVSAFEAKHIMGMVVGWLGTHAESQLDTTTHVAQKCLALRAWSATHGGRKPSPSAVFRMDALDDVAAATTEAALGAWLRNWKHDGKRSEHATVSVLLRHYSTLRDFMFGESASEKTIRVAKEANKLLKDGYAIKREWESRPHDTTLKELKCTTFGKEIYKCMWNFLNGQGTEIADTLLEGVDAERAAWMRAAHTGNRPKLLERVQRVHKEQAERRRAVKEAVESMQGASTSVQLDACDENDASDDDDE